VVIEGLGLPYMGSKRKLAPAIINFILRDNPDCKYFYDLFGGGGAMSFCALQIPQIKKVVYNELNTSIYNLLLKIKNEGVTSEFYEWVSRESFFELLKGSDWKSGLAKCVWSFGNDQRYYIFGKDIENIKMLLHEVIVNFDEKALNELKHLHGIIIPDSILNLNSLFEVDSINARRLRVIDFIKSQYNRIDLEQLEQLERQQQLQRLQQLQQLQQLELQNRSFEQVEILESGAIIYLDPPYFNTKKYEQKVCHESIKEYVHNSRHKIYLSSYENVYDMELVFSMEHRSTQSATNNAKKVTENLYTNKR
jgi:site-specific DNA-adenine methylase